MKNIIRICLFIFCFQNMALGKSWPEIYKQNTPGIVFIFSKGGLCSGALISDQLILTAWHCVSAARPIHVGWSDNPEESLDAFVVAADSNRDLAILQLEKKVTKPILQILEEKGTLVEGDAIATIGHPMGAGLDKGGLKEGHSYIMSSGIVSRVGPNHIITDMAVNPGNSGGPVFNSDGKIIAVVSAKLGGVLVDNIGYLISYKHIHTLLKKLNDAQKDKKPFPAPFPKSSVYFGMQYFTDSDLARFNANKDGFAFEFGAYLYDRFHLAWNKKFVESSDYSALSVDQVYVGYQLQYEFTNSLVMTFTPAFGRKYVFSPNNLEEVKNLIALRTQVLGFNLTYEAQTQDLRKRSLSIGVSFWNW